MFDEPLLTLLDDMTLSSVQHGAEANEDVATQIINNSEFPQIVIIPQKANQLSSDEVRIKFNDGKLEIDGGSLAEEIEEQRENDGEETEFRQVAGRPRQALLRAQQRQRILIAQLVRSMKAAERMKNIETAMKKQTVVLDQLQANNEVTRPDNGLNEKRLTALEAASARQAVILRELNEAVHDVSIGSSNNAAKLQLLELVAAKQKRLLNDLLTTPLSPVVDPEVNEERLKEIEDEIARKRTKEAAALEERRRNALEQIEEMSEMIQRTRKTHSERMRLARVLNSVNDPPLAGLHTQEETDMMSSPSSSHTMISPSSRSMVWWQRLNSGFRQRRQLHRNLRSLVVD